MSAEAIGAKIPPRVYDTDCLVPVFRQRLLRTMAELDHMYVVGQTPTRFKVFETYRDPMRQLVLYRAGKSKALPFKSEHQFGLAADVVPLDSEGRFTWEPADESAWLTLRSTAIRYGLDTPIQWDKAHVCMPRVWSELRTLLQV